jgi:hypothetical protein
VENAERVNMQKEKSVDSQQTTNSWQDGASPQGNPCFPQKQK